jgi:hypothetical protein
VRLSGLFVTLILLAVVGCGSDRPYYRVNGKVQFNKDDSFARFGSVEFRSESEPIVTARGNIQKDGSFTLKSGRYSGTVGGWHTVVVLQPVANPHRGIIHDHGLEAAKKYGDHRTTDLRVEVTEESASDLLLLIDELAK